MRREEAAHIAPTVETGLSRKLTPPELARLWRVSPQKVLAWISSGELRAINAATNPNGERPRYLIDADAVTAFERSRAVVEPKPAPQKRRAKKPTTVTTYF
ncbi:Helix-turn-helix domain protein [Botrimarina colliarenosi]|uniref:Helix-turn-helix domain protein n=2 Tax=Botrimarina colliarenosi TaxID=2528001 RepID=A0A5C5ZZG8_9BACT|nr:Helix-turn-helix domain protein [Botrimarina colliarenosi]